MASWHFEQAHAENTENLKGEEDQFANDHGIPAECVCPAQLLGNCTFLVVRSTFRFAVTSRVHCRRLRCDACRAVMFQATQEWARGEAEAGTCLVANTAQTFVIPSHIAQITFHGLRTRFGTRLFSSHFGARKVHQARPRLHEFCHSRLIKLVLRIFWGLVGSRKKPLPETDVLDILENKVRQRQRMRVVYNIIAGCNRDHRGAGAR